MAGLVRVAFTPSQLMTLADIVTEYVQWQGHTDVYVDVVRAIHTTPIDLLALLLAALERRPSPMRWKIRYQARSGHIHCRVFTAPRGLAFAKAGDLVFSTAEWPHVRDVLQDAGLVPEEA